MAGGGAASPSDELETSQYSLEEMQAIVFEAESAGKYVAAHCYSDRGIKLCCKAGIRTIEHGNLLTESSAQAMKETGTYLVPTMATYVMISKIGRDLGLSDDFIRKINQALEKAESSLGIALSKGLKIGSGSDLLGPMQTNKGLELELQAKVMGGAQFAGDIRLPKMMYGKVLRPPGHGAKLKNVDLSAAKMNKDAIVLQEGDFIAVVHPLPDMAENTLSLIKAEYELPEATVDDRNIYERILNTTARDNVIEQKGDLALLKHTAPLRMSEKIAPLSGSAHKGLSELTAK